MFPESIRSQILTELTKLSLGFRSILLIVQGFRNSPWNGTRVSLGSFTHAGVYFRRYYLLRNYERRGTLEESAFRCLCGPRVSAYPGSFWNVYATLRDMWDFSVHFTWRGTQWHVSNKQCTERKSARRTMARQRKKLIFWVANIHISFHCNLMLGWLEH